MRGQVDGVNRSVSSHFTRVGSLIKMIFEPIVQAVAMERAVHHDREAAYSSEPCSVHLRLSDQQVNELTDEFHEWKNVMGMASIAKSKQKICTFLHYLASGGYYRQVGYAMVIAKSTTVATVHEVADFLMAIAPRYISLPQPAEYEELSSDLIDADGNIRRVLLYIDGAIIRMQRSDYAGDAYFCGRHGKSCDSLNVQYVVDKFGRVRHVISGLPGATHDKPAAEWSPELMDFLDELPLFT